MLLAAAMAVHKVPKDGEGVKSGPIGLAVILLLCVAVYFLFKSMSKHLKRVREEFPADTPVQPHTAHSTRADAAHIDEPAAEVAGSPPKADSP